MAQNEKTSERVASIASKVLNMAKPTIMTNELWEEIRTLAASALTQAPDKVKPLTDQESFAAAWAAINRPKALDSVHSIGKATNLFQALKDYEKKKP